MSSPTRCGTRSGRRRSAAATPCWGQGKAQPHPFGLIGLRARPSIRRSWTPCSPRPPWTASGDQCRNPGREPRTFPRCGASIAALAVGSEAAGASAGSAGDSTYLWDTTTRKITATLADPESEDVQQQWRLAGGGPGGELAAREDGQAGIGKVRKAAAKLGATALVIAPVGGVLGSGTHSETVDRTLLTARSVEFDALVVAGGTTPTGDIKLMLLLQEAFRHCKVLAAWGDGTAVLEAAGIIAGAAGVITGDTAVKSFTGRLAAAVGLHRAWDRAPAVMASAVPPVLTS